MTRLFFILTVLFTLTTIPFLAVGQNKNSYKVEYTKYSSDGKIIKDTTMTIKKYPIVDGWTCVLGNDTIRIDREYCNCKVRIYNQEKLIEEFFLPSGADDMDKFEWHQYQYNQKGQLKSDGYKMMNLPWMTTNYEYDNKGRLEKEITNTARYGDYSVKYIYDNEKLIMKITNDNNRIDTLKVKTK